MGKKGRDKILVFLPSNPMYFLPYTRLLKE